SYNDALGAGGPRSLFLKIPHVLSESSAVLGVDDHAEVDFYREVAPGIGCPPLVRCYDAAYLNETKHSHILLEDLTETHSQPEQNTAPCEDMSRLAVEALAKVHARCWKQPISHLGSAQSDLAHWGIPASSAAPPLKRQHSYLVPEFDLRRFISNLNSSVTRFLDVADLTPAQEREYRRMLHAADLIWGRLTRREHLTVTHGDLHWWNFLYPRDPYAHSVRLIDWHLWHMDVGARDLAFLLALGGFAEPRPEIEAELLDVYHETLIQNGVAGYSAEMLMEDYRWSAIRNLNIPVIYWSQGKHYTTWQTALRRALAAYERLDCTSLLVVR
ncbi:MAG TPA: oxidoreductase family protein, partial [Pyrinomonadaceae bacterium]